MRKHLPIWFLVTQCYDVVLINITHIPEEQVAFRQCTRPSLPPAKAWLREARLGLGGFSRLLLAEAARS